MLNARAQVKWGGVQMCAHSSQSMTDGSLQKGTTQTKVGNCTLLNRTSACMCQWFGPGDLGSVPGSRFYALGAQKPVSPAQFLLFLEHGVPEHCHLA